MSKPGPSILGWGAATALGPTWQATRERLLAGETGPGVESLNGSRTRLARAGYLPDDPGSPRFTRLARRALDDLQSTLNPPEEGSLGIVAASSKGAWGEQTQPVTGAGNPGVWAARLARRFPRDVQRVASPTTACATGLSAVLQGCRWIADGEVDQVLVVASESCFSPLLMAGYQNLGVLCDEHGMRPFHPERSGFALGEAAAALWLAHPDRVPGALDRAVGRLLGWAETCDAHHVTRMEEGGTRLRDALRLTRDRSGLEEDAVDLLHAHLTTTDHNDRTEFDLLDDWSGDAVLQGIKPALGHTIGASGLLELIATADSLATGELFPLANRCADRTPRAVRPAGFERRPHPRFGITWNMGFGGHNAAACVSSPGT